MKEINQTFSSLSFLNLSLEAVTLEVTTHTSHHQFFPDSSIYSFFFLSLIFWSTKHFTFGIRTLFPAPWLKPILHPTSMNLSLISTLLLTTMPILCKKFPNNWMLIHSSWTPSILLCKSSLRLKKRDNNNLYLLNPHLNLPNPQCHELLRYHSQTSQSVWNWIFRDSEGRIQHLGYTIQGPLVL